MIEEHTCFSFCARKYKREPNRVTCVYRPGRANHLGDDDRCRRCLRSKLVTRSSRTIVLLLLLSSYYFSLFRRSGLATPRSYVYGRVIGAWSTTYEFYIIGSSKLPIETRAPGARVASARRQGRIKADDL